MTINPIAFADEVNKQFLRYQLTAFPLSDPEMADQAKQMLEGVDPDSHLVKGPYISLSRSFAEGEFIEVLVNKGILHPAIKGVAEYPKMFAHQQRVLEEVKKENHVLVSTGTGSGKTEAFLYPIIDHCLTLRDDPEAPTGITAILVYPMNALASDQLGRLRHLLAGTGISFGMYVGSTPADENEMGSEYIRMKDGEGKDKIPFYERKYEDHPNIKISPFEERITEKEMVEAPPRILLTNINQLEFLLTRGKDLSMFENAPLRFLVIDEAHTYTGSKGAEVSILIRRLRAFCNKDPDEVICIGTSATITDPESGDEPAKRFAQRFFGIDRNRISLVEEVYQDEAWPPSLVKPPILKDDFKEMFQRTLEAIDGDGDPKKISDIISKISSQELDDSIPWRESLYHALKSSKMVKVIYDTLVTPMLISDATKVIWEKVGRKEVNRNSELELMIYLALGAAAEKDGSPILRPQLHFFVRGMGGAAAVLREPTNGETEVKLYFSQKKAGEENPERLPSAIFPVLTCTNCGQHFFEAYVGHLDEGKGLTGGLAEDGNVYWPVTGEDEGKKVIFTNRFYSEEEEDEDSDYTKKLDKKREDAWVCKYCGSIHHGESNTCSRDDCKRKDSLLHVYLLNEHDEVKTCPSCGQRGGKFSGKFKSPLRSLRAVTVADIHILAQDMINSQKADNRKLIIFADNRQDSAFQAAWMADHARRYRLRHIIYDMLTNASHPLSVGDLQRTLNKYFKDHKDLARSLAPEVFAGLVEEAYSSKIEKDMLKFLRIIIIRELVTGYHLRDSLETLGLIRVKYHKLDENNEYVQGFAAKYNISVEDTLQGFETILDFHRRGTRFYDPETPIFSQYWHSGCEEVQRGFLPLWDFPPKALKHIRGTDDKAIYITGFNSNRGITSTRDFVQRWGIERDDVNDAIEDIWNIVTRDLKLLIPVTLKSSAGNPLPGQTGAYQIDSTKVGITHQYERYRCRICNRYHARDTPNHVCTKKNCPGVLIEEKAPDENYNVSLLNKEFSMLMVHEHTAQVPIKKRYEIENQFKKPEGTVNCLVATPTLELGVDIGDLDMILMRNVPPLASNYWQRAGRAGRRHRMAVIYSYCRKSVHDEYFYEDPMRLLSGKIDPPNFNLRNPVMIRKHTHAAIMSELIRYSITNDRKIIPEDEQLSVIETLKTCFPSFISEYLFEERRFRDEPVDTSILADLISRYNGKIVTKIKEVFCKYWPDEGQNEIEDPVIISYIDEMSRSLSKQVNLIHERMMWAKITRNLLMDKEKTVTKLEEIERKLLYRCKKYIEELGKKHLENYTLNVLSRGGFLPGYATYQGNVTAFSNSAFSRGWEKMTFELSRADTIAIREFVPGNLIYANGGKYKVSWYHLPLDKQTLEPEKYWVNPVVQHFQERSQPLDGYADDEYLEIKGTKICDADLAFMSHVSDDEENRFRMPVQMAGHLKVEHRGIDEYSVGQNKTFFHHHGQMMRLGNIGPADKVAEGILGYPFCRVCGATRSPYASDTEIEKFKEKHKEACGEVPENYCFTADNQVDGLYFKGLTSLSETINIAEGIRTSANIHLEMDPEDLQIQVFRLAEEEFNVMIYDPMPGGSGLLDQIIEKWEKIIAAGIEALGNCRGNCETSCYDCLRTYRNMFYHPNLDRFEAVKLLEDLNTKPKKVSSLPPNVPNRPRPKGGSTNTPEMRLSRLLQEHGFPPFDKQHEIKMEGSIKRTVPDFYYEDQRKDIKIAIYLDGLSKNIHGNAERQRTDHFIRSYLRSKGYDVIEIAATDLDDPAILNMHVSSIAKALSNKE